MKKLTIAFFSAVILFTISAFVGSVTEEIPNETGFADTMLV